MSDVTIPEKVGAYLAAPWREWTETYVIANSVGMRGKTPAVRRELKRMLKAGQVECRASWRHNMLEWKLSAIRSSHE